MDSPDRETLLEEYRQLMESQRDNTRISYSWMGTIFLVFCSGLFFFGLTSDSLSSFIPAMTLGICLCLIWVGLTEVFARYIRQRLQRLEEIAKELGIPPFPFRERTSRRLWRILLVGYASRWLPLTQARTYVVLFASVYIVVWVLRLILAFVI